MSKTKAAPFGLTANRRAHVGLTWQIGRGWPKPGAALSRSERRLLSTYCIGGECPAGVVPDGVRCTWSAQPLGEVTLDELSERPRGPSDNSRSSGPRGGRGGPTGSSTAVPEAAVEEAEEEQEEMAEAEEAEEEETYEAFCARGGFEWKEECDCAGGPCVARGSTAQECGLAKEYSCFWDGRMDARRNAERVAELDRRFVAKYPAVPGDARPPTCQWQ